MNILIKILEEQSLSNSQIGIIVSAVLALLAGLVAALKKLGWDKEAKKVEDTIEIVKKAEDIIKNTNSHPKTDEKEAEKN